MLVLCTAFSALVLAAPAFAAFGFTTSGNNINVDTGAGLTFTVDKTNGDLTSILFNSKQAQDQSGKHSQIASGIGASCSAAQTGTSNNFVKVTCTASGITHYYVAQNGVPNIHMATFTTQEPSVGELRYIARLNRATLPNGVVQSDVNGGTAIEGSDVFNVNGQTRSKFYSSRQFIDDAVHGVSGSGIAAFMIVPGTGFEASSGGPFFRDIDNQGTSQQELYFYMNSGHTQTEANRMGLHGPYALAFTTGSTPGTFDTSFWGSLGVSGFVAQSGRGRVQGKATGISSQFSSLISVSWKNSQAQYWVRADSSGNFVSPFMIPGTYTQTLNKVELGVATSSVTVSAGGTTTANIASTEPAPALIWQIGDYDGTPRGFLNADKIETMHPSDSRMSKWGPVTYTVGSSSVGSFPLAIFKAIGGVTIKFTLTSSQIGARTLKIGTTNAFADGRPVVQVNSWTGPTPAAPDEPDSRGVTRGTWRGNNIAYTVSIPSGTLVAGSNTIVINVASGSSGDTYLSPNFIFDAIQLF